MTEAPKGTLYTLIAFIFGGLFPIYFKVLSNIPALQTACHRVVWSLPLLLGFVWLKRSSGKAPIWLALKTPQTLGLFCMATFLLAVNWLTSIWAFNHGRVVECSLGYFINPLISVALGMLFLHERLRPIQWFAVALACVAMIYLTFVNGRLPWIGLTLATSFALYSLVKKKVPLDALPGMVIETGLLWPLALAYLIFCEAQNSGYFPAATQLETIFLVGSGIVTATSLLFFAAGAQRIPLSKIGLLLYTTPTIQFVVGITIFEQKLNPQRLFGFTIVWIALAIFIVEGVVYQKKRYKPQRLSQERLRR